MPTQDRAEATPLLVETGALDDGRHLLRQYAIAALGWAATIAVIVWLALEATGPAVRVTLFLVTVCVVVALVGVFVAVEIFRAPLISERARSLPAPRVDDGIDGLGRRVVVPAEGEPTGELTIEEIDGLRRYRTADP